MHRLPGRQMKPDKIKARPVRLTSGCKRDVRTQFGALCYRVRRDKVQVLLITSRTNRRWILPKGWPIDGASPAEAAAQEAWEEAGVEGRVMGNCLGVYSYNRADDDDLPCVVAIFPIKVKRLRSDYPEAAERDRKWVTPKKASVMLAEPELRQMVRDFDPTSL